MATWAELVERDAKALCERKALGAALRAWREARGWRLVDVGDRLGRDQSAVYRVEEGGVGGKVGREYAHEAGMLDRWRALPERPDPHAMKAAAQRALVGAE